MDSPGTSHDQETGDLAQTVFSILQRLHQTDWSRLAELDQEGDENEDESEGLSLLEVRNAAIAALTLLSDRVSERMYT